MRRGFTLIELLVVVAIIAILVLLAYGGIGAWSNSSFTEEFDAKVIRKFEYNHGGDTGGTEFRVDVQRRGSPTVETLTNQDDRWNDDKVNSGTIQANLIEGDWYHFRVRGQRNESWSLYPNIRDVPTKIQSPDDVGNVEEGGEIDY